MKHCEIAFNGNTNDVPLFGILMGGSRNVGKLDMSSRSCGRRRVRNVRMVVVTSKLKIFVEILGFASIDITTHSDSQLPKSHNQIRLNYRSTITNILSADNKGNLPKSFEELLRAKGIRALSRFATQELEALHVRYFCFFYADIFHINNFAYLKKEKS